jgi:hypothetical protein
MKVVLHIFMAGSLFKDCTHGRRSFHARWQMPKSQAWQLSMQRRHAILCGHEKGGIVAPRHRRAAAIGARSRVIDHLGTNHPVVQELSLHQRTGIHFVSHFRKLLAKQGPNPDQKSSPSSQTHHPVTAMRRGLFQSQHCQGNA